jgi:polyisoprenyl-phosphate glycosyltransferase
MNTIESLARELHGPILVLGASGFVGANLMRAVLEVRSDVFGTASREPAWRLASIGADRHITVDLLARGNVAMLLERVQPGTIFDCVAYGAYSFEQDVERMYQTNVVFKQELIEQLLRRGTHCYIHAGSSSEYGARSAAPDEGMAPAPNSHYAVTKNAAAGLVYFAGHHRGLRCANLRLYSVYGPLEDRSRLIPTLVAQAAEGRLPPFVDPETSRDFIYVDDVVRVVLWLLETKAVSGLFNVGTGRARSFRDLIAAAYAALGDNPKIEYVEMPADIRGAYQYFTQADTTKLERAGYAGGFLSLEEGVHDYVTKYLDRPDRYR